MSELSCDTPFIGQIGALDLVRNPVRIRISLGAGTVRLISSKT